jgi:hypothetical protein
VLLAPYLQACSLAVDLPDRPAANAAFSFKSPYGGELEAGTYTRDTVDTTLGGAAAKGATSVTVASATGITVGRAYLLTASEDTGGERVVVRAISDTTVTLVRPTRLDHASGAAFKSSRVTCALTTTGTAAHGRHHRLELTWTVATVAQPTAVFAVDVCKYIPLSFVTFADVQALDALAGKRLPLGTWWPELRDHAWQMLLRRVAAKVAPGALVGTVDLTQAHLYLCRMLMAETAGAEWDEYRQLMASRFGDEFDAALTTGPVDNDADGAVEAHEGVFRGVDLMRS